MKIPPSPSRRLFLAIPLPPTAIQALAGCSFQHPAIRWMLPANFHITVYFFGNTQENAIAELSKHIRAIASSTEPFELHFEKLIFSPQGNFPRMIWADFQSNPHFEPLVAKIQNIATTFLHQKQENHSPRPHVTLARFRGHIDILAQELAKLDILPLSVKILHLMESRLLPSGSKYSLLSEFPLEN